MIQYGLNKFSPGKSVPLCNPCNRYLWSFALTLVGRAKQQRKDGYSIWGPGDLSIIKPFGMHGWRVLEGSDWKVIYFLLEPEPEWTALLDLPEITPGSGCCLVKLKGHPEEKHVRHAMLEAYAYLTGGSRPVDHRLAANAITRALLWVNRVANPSRSTLDIRLDKALTHIRKNIGLQLSLASIAKAAGISASLLYLLFMQEYKIPPMAYVENERIKTASEMLKHSCFSIKEITLQCGYSDQRYFASRFKHHRGCSPTQYRKMWRHS